MKNKKNNGKIQEKSKNSGSKMDKTLLIISVLLILVGAGVFLYPNVSNFFAEKNHVEAIRQYSDVVSTYDETQIEEERQKAQIFNENLAGDPVHDPFVEGSGYAMPENYKEVLNIAGDGVMAYIEIPKIKVHLPIYHGTSSEVLEKGVGHIESTSLPIGGLSTHSVLTGHTGLPSAELFTRLDELEVGDIFYIHVLNDVLTYKIYETKVILPDEIDELRITNGKDYVTLVTCTPYGVNTHRLLVKGERTEYEEYVETTGTTETQEGDTTNEEKAKENYYLKGIKIGLAVLAIILLMIIIVVIKKKKKEEDK